MQQTLRRNAVDSQVNELVDFDMGITLHRLKTEEDLEYKLKHMSDGNDFN